MVKARVLDAKSTKLTQFFPRYYNINGQEITKEQYKQEQASRLKAYWDAKKRKKGEGS
jgi:hypothetical protein